MWVPCVPAQTRTTVLQAQISKIDAKELCNMLMY